MFYGHNILFIYSAVGKHENHFQFLAICYKYLKTSLCGHTLSFLLNRYLAVELLGPMVTFMFTFLRKCQIVWASAIVHSYCKKVPVSSHVHQYLVSSVFFYCNHSVDVNYFIIGLSGYITIINDDVEHIVMFL